MKCSEACNIQQLVARQVKRKTEMNTKFEIKASIDYLFAANKCRYPRLSGCLLCGKCLENTLGQDP